MEFLNIENILFCSDILFIYSSQENKEDEREDDSILIPLKLLCTVNAFYFYTQDLKNAIQKEGTLLRQTTEKSSSNQHGFSLNNSSILGKKNASYSKGKLFEEIMLLKLNHVDIYMNDYNIEYLTVSYSQFNTNIKNVYKSNIHFTNTQYQNVINAKSYKFKFKYSTQNEKNLLKLLLLLDGYKYSVKVTVNPQINNINNTQSQTIAQQNTLNHKGTFYNSLNINSAQINYFNSEYIYKLFDSVISNNFTLVINNDFFDEDAKILKKFTDFCAFFQNVKITCILYDEEENTNAKLNSKNEEQNNMNVNTDLETYTNAFCDRFNLDKNDQTAVVGGHASEKTSNKDKVTNMLLTSNPSFFCYSFIYVDASNTYLNDRGFIRVIIPLLEKSPFLTKLVLKHNILTNIVIFKLNESKSYSLHHIDLSYNKINNGNLHQELIFFVKHFFHIENIILRGNYITNTFLKKFNIKSFDIMLKEIKAIMNSNDSNCKVIIDLRENLLDNEVLNKQFYLWNIETYQFSIMQREHFEEIKTKYFTRNRPLSKKDNLISKYKNKEYKHIQLIFDYPYIRYSKNYIDTKCKSFSITSKYFELKKDTQNVSNENELALYQKLFKFFFLLDYYFDPVLNSFSHSRSVFMTHKKTFMNSSNQNETYKELKELYETSEKDLKEMISIQEEFYNNLFEKKTLMTNSDTIINPIQFRLEQFEIPKYKAYEMCYMYKKNITEKNNINSITNAVLNIKQKKQNSSFGCAVIVLRKRKKSFEIPNKLKTFKILNKAN